MSNLKMSQALQKYGVKKLWYVLHVANLVSVLNHGILCRNEILRKGLKYEDISDPLVQRWRKELHDYVPLFFADNTPMLYRCFQEHESNIVLLAIDTTVADIEGVKFSDGNIASRNTKIYNDPSDLAKLDWKTILSRQGSSDKEWKRKKSAELLVPKRVPSEFITCVHIPSSMAPVWRPPFAQFRIIGIGVVVEDDRVILLVPNLTREGVR